MSKIMDNDKELVKDVQLFSPDKDLGSEKKCMPEEEKEIEEPKPKHIEAEDENQCGICLQGFEEGEKLKALDCHIGDDTKSK